MKILVKSKVPGDIIMRDNCYVVMCPSLGLVVYGKTKDAANDRMSKAIDIWHSRLNDKGLLINRLDAWGIPFEVVHVPSPMIKKSSGLGGSDSHCPVAS